MQYLRPNRTDKRKMENITADRTADILLPLITIYVKNK